MFIFKICVWIKSGNIFLAHSVYALFYLVFDRIWQYESKKKIYLLTLAFAKRSLKHYTTIMCNSSGTVWKPTLLNIPSKYMVLQRRRQLI